LSSLPFRCAAFCVLNAFAAACVLFIPAIAGADTTIAVPEAATPVVLAAKKVGTRTLRSGDHGPRVKALQTLLTQAGFKTSTDGNFGATTAKVVRRFQRAARLRPNGVADGRTIAALQGATNGAVAQNASGGFDAAGSIMPAPAALTPGTKATVGSDGLAVAPADAPDQVTQIIAAGNEIAKTPYHYGGGHGRWQDSGYDCSGSVSYALHGAALLDSALTSGDFAGWGDRGPGQWVTIYAKSSHVYMVVAGLRFDTSGRSAAGTRWQTASRSAGGYTVVHPTGL
jgi:peptidoglycan hydrolase-like protein with peptidoglycan-binding domain